MAGWNLDDVITCPWTATGHERHRRLHHGPWMEDAQVQSTASSQSNSRGRLAALACWGVFAAMVLFAWTVVQGPVRAQTGEDATTNAGTFLWDRDCASCHGTAAEGTAWGPSLQGKGPAGVSLAVTTGRMPLPAAVVKDRTSIAFGDLQVDRGPVAYSPQEIDALVSHARTFIEGPDVPHVDIADADLTRGAAIFQLNCASCHTWSGRGGALTSGRVAVSLTHATPTQVVESMRSGLGTMPVFTEATLDDDEATDVAAYVAYLQDPVTPLGSPLGFIGPVAEGFVAWLIGIAGLLLVVRWIGLGGSVDEHE